MRPRVNVILILAVFLSFVLFMSVFAVDERESVLKFRFGRIVGSDFAPGLHTKVPFAERVQRFPDTILRTVSSDNEKFLTRELKNLVVDYFITWRITDAAEYYRSTRGIEQNAIDRLSPIVKEGIKAAISQRTVQQAVSADRADLMQDMLLQVQARSPELGIEIVDVRVKRIDLADEVSDSVYQRMRQERDRVAQQLRAEGNEEKARIQSEADRQEVVLLSEANRDAERIRGEGDARAADIYAQAFSQDPEFYEFYRSMLAYRNAIGDQNDILVLKPDSDFFKFLQSRSGVNLE